METIVDYDLFGNVIVKDELLRDKFIEPPFSILDSRLGGWQKRKQLWISKGIKSEIGRDVKTYGKFTPDKGNPERFDKISTSIFDPALCEVLYHWFCNDGGKILDPFAGGSVRGIVANYMGFKYSGIEIRHEQVESNREQALEILPINNQPQWYVGDSNKLLDGEWSVEFDMIMSCPPYADLEVYSDLDGDISNKPYKQFLELYESIISKSCKLLKDGGYACFVVGEVRDKSGDYIGFVPDTIKAFQKCGMKFYNEAILLNQSASAAMRANGNMKTQKLVKIHQNVLIFRKPTQAKGGV
jgi:DNA modification methylase